jgi:ribosomal protein S12 methylthiotransferase accessory factor
MGITRIADITGLDRLGIPVMQVVRPFSLSNSVSQGKGPDSTAAAISAILEAAECCMAERLDCFPTQVTSARALEIPPDRFKWHLREDSTPAWHETDTAWTTAHDLLSGNPAWVPFELVHTAYIHPARPHDGMFLSSTTGLAASFVEAEAVTHGILECIERDAIARAMVTHGFLQRSRIDLATIDHPGLAELIGSLTAKGMLVALWHAPIAVGVPVIWCQLMESEAMQDSLLPYQSDGSAASLDVAATIGHAIYEAAQTRLAAISGARDDMTRAAFPKYPNWDRIRAHRRLLRNGPCSVDFRALVDASDAAGGNELDRLLSLLRKAGVPNVFLTQIDTASVSDLRVVRLVIPALLPLLDG